MDLRSIDLKKLNSITKYPSIPTYHALDPKNGRLLEERVEFSGPVVLTEKVDGTNSRIIVRGDDYIIGSREELLHARGDRIFNPSMGIVEAVLDLAGRVAGLFGVFLAIVYVEAYGGNIGAAAKQYTSSKATSARLFDIALFSGDDLSDLLERDPASISSWRESGGQHFEREEALAGWADATGVPLAPRIAEVDGAQLPQSVSDASNWLSETIRRSRVTLDDAAGGAPEGVVIRALDRSKIAKMRFDDYRRTLKVAKR